MLPLKSAHVFALITGASRGFGRSIATQFLSQILPQHPASVTLNLHASPASQSRLDDAKATLHADSEALLSASSCALHINTVTLDLRSATVDTALPLLRRGDDADADIAFLFSNAGVLQSGRIDSDAGPGPDGALAASLAVNTVAVGTVMAAFLQTFKPPTKRVLTYTSTICAISPFASWPGYSVSKAATEMLHRVAAAENTDARVLLYAPGPMGTDMVSNVGSDAKTDPGLQEWFRRSQQNQSFVHTDESAAKMIGLLVADEYEDAQHIDFFDT